VASGLVLHVASGCTVPTEDFVDPRGDLLIEWVFDEPGASTLLDTTTPVEELALEGPTWVTDDGPTHASFDGVDDVGRGPDLQGWIPTLGAITLEARVRIDTQGEDWNVRPIVALPQTTDEGIYPLGLVAYTAAERLELSLGAGGSRLQVNTDRGYPSGEWITIHGVYDGEQAWLYVDGEVIAGPATASGRLDGHDFDDNRQDILVGGTGQDGGQLACDLASLRVYGRPLVADEVRYRHEQFVTGEAP
jgi:hypothetical protein